MGIKCLLYSLWGYYNKRVSHPEEMKHRTTASTVPLTRDRFASGEA